MSSNILSKDDFKKLWALNPTVDNPQHDYENTYNLASGIIFVEIPTVDGELITFDLLFDRYSKHIQVKSILNDGVETRYQKKQNQIKPLYEYLANRHFNHIEKLPENSRHFYFWGNLSKEEIESHFKKFLAQCK